MKTVIEMAREAGFRVGPSRDGPDDVWGVGANLERFAALVIANHPPQSYMSWQEGFAAGRQAERENLQSLLRQMTDAYTLSPIPGGLKQRGKKNDYPL